MTIQSQTGKTVYVANGTATAFTVPFYFFNKEIAVYKNSTLLSEGTDYTLQGSGEVNGGEITFNTAPAANTVITIVRNVELTQLVKFMEGENFPAADYEKSLDRIIMALQQLRDKLSECVSIPKGTSMSGDDLCALLVLVSQNMENINALPEILSDINDMSEELTAKFADYYDKDEIDSQISGVTIKRFNNVSVNVADIVSDETYEDYPYRADITLSGAVSGNIPAVIFSLADATSGNYAPVSSSYQGGVKIYMKEIPSSNITIPSIVLY